MRACTVVGPAVVITNFHVVESLVNGASSPSNAIIRFDYKRLDDGTTLNSGMEFHLASEDWLVDSSPPSPADLIPEPKEELPTSSELDYALLRLAEPVGSQPVGKKGDPATRRGWIPLTRTEYTFPPDSPLFILQHPLGVPLKLLLDTHGIIRANKNGTRVLYRTNTDRGSSGSPCFDQNWNLVALHHLGDPAYERRLNPTYNEGIPTTAIYDLVYQRGKREALGMPTC